MGELICLDTRRKARSRAPEEARPTFFFDLACPLSYLVAERIERTLGDVDWVPVSAPSRAARLDRADLDELREYAESRARRLRLPLVWPDRFPAPVPCALRAAAYASEIGAGASFALAASRLAFCGGFDLDDPEALAEAAAAAGVPLDACLKAAGAPEQDEPLAIAADVLRSRGGEYAPAIDIGGRLLAGDAGLAAVSLTLGVRPLRTGPLAPAG
jgi:2-hydroxychromene-2-carboxylate isomerase